MLRRRQCQRYTKRLEVAFSPSPGGTKYRGISSDLSSGGLFIRTQHGLSPGTFLDIDLYLPDQKVSTLKGIVRRTVKTALSAKKNGMGIEIIERDQHYLDLMRGISSSPEESDEDTVTPSEKEQISEETEAQKESAREQPGEKSHTVTESLIIRCKACSARNRVPRARLGMEPRCGRCGEKLQIEDIG